MDDSFPSIHINAVVFLKTGKHSIVIILFIEIDMLFV